jgi:hypothetical protein
MSTTEFFYKTPEGMTGGPLEWDAIRAAWHAGRLPKSAMVSQREAGPWVGVDAVERAGFSAFGQQEAPAPVAEVKPEPGYEAPMLASFLEVLGFFGFVGSALCAALAVTVGPMVLLLGALSGTVSSAMCLAMGRILGIVSEIRWEMGRRK